VQQKKKKKIADYAAITLSSYLQIIHIMKNDFVQSYGIVEGMDKCPPHS